MCADPHRGCMITSSIEVVLASLGFILSASAIKFQDKFNEAVIAGLPEGTTMDSPLNITVASVACAFFFLGIMTASSGIHGYRMREAGSSRWFYLAHFIFAIFLSLCYFAIFIDGIVQFNKMNAHVAEEETPLASPQNATTVTPAEDEQAEKIDVKAVVSRLGLPFAIIFVHIMIYMVSGRFAYKAWREYGDTSTVQREILEEEPEEKQNQNPI